MQELFDEGMRDVRKRRALRLQRRVRKKGMAGIAETDLARLFCQDDPRI